MGPPLSAKSLLQSRWGEAYSAEVQASMRSGNIFEGDLRTLFSSIPADFSFRDNKTAATSGCGSRSTVDELPVIKLPQGIHREQLTWNVKFVLEQFFRAKPVSASLLREPGLTLDFVAVDTDSVRNTFQVRRFRGPAEVTAMKDQLEDVWQTMTLEPVTMPGTERKAGQDTSKSQDLWGFGGLEHESILLPLTTKVGPVSFALNESNTSCTFMHVIVLKLGDGRYRLHYPSVDYEEPFAKLPGCNKERLAAQAHRKRGIAGAFTDEEKLRAKRLFGPGFS